MRYRAVIFVALTACCPRPPETARAHLSDYQRGCVALELALDELDALPASAWGLERVCLIDPSYEDEVVTAMSYWNVQTDQAQLQERARRLQGFPAR